MHQNFIGSRSTFENLKLIQKKGAVFQTKLMPEHKDVLFKDLDNVLPEAHREKIWHMLLARWCEYEKLCNL